MFNPQVGTGTDADSISDQSGRKRVVCRDPGSSDLMLLGGP